MGSPCPHKQSDRGVLMENKIIGKPRMRMIRVTNSSCEIPETFGGIIKRCYGRYSESLEDKETFIPERLMYSSENAWTYRTSEELESSALSHWGKAGTTLRTQQMKGC